MKTEHPAFLHKDVGKQTKMVENLIEMRAGVVPILGEDIYYIKVGEEHLSIHQYLLDCFIKEYGDKGITEEDKSIIINGSYYGLSRLERFFPGDFETDYRRYIRYARKQNIIHIDPIIREFLEEFEFPLVLTTSPFNLIEDSLTGIKYTSQSYSPLGSNFHSSLGETPTVYHIFGSINDGGQWVYDEDKLLEFLHALHNEDTSSVALKNYMDTRNCRILAIGCNLPDWLFRFLWFPIKSSSNDHRQKKGYWINKRENSKSFEDFLENIKFFSSTGVKEILNQATNELRKIKEEKGRDKDLNPSNIKYDGFLSYASEDKDLALRIYSLLKNKGYNIWFDKEGKGRIEPGSNYMKRIVEGVSASTFYIPLVTENFITKILNPESNLKKEMDIVRNHYNSFDSPPDRYSIPIIIEGREFNDEIITSGMIEGLTRFILPKQLFLNINMYSISPSATQIDLDL